MRGLSHLLRPENVRRPLERMRSPPQFRTVRAGDVLADLLHPPEATRKMAWHRRLVRKMQRGLLWLLGLAMIGLTGAVLLLSWQLLRVWMMS